MKKIFSLLSFLLIICQMALAGPVDESQAFKVAENFFGGGTTKSQLKMSYKAPYKKFSNGKGESNLFYVINRGHDQGYIVVAADNRVMPILAFSDKGSLTEDDLNAHPSIKWLYDEYRNEIKWAIENTPDIPSPEYKKAITSRDAANYEVEIQPLLEYATDRATKLETPISWGQSWPFNQYSPNYRYNGRTYPTVSGCVATAISTVLRWHKWPRKAKGSVSYYWKNNYMSLNFDGNGPENAAYDWSQMPAGVDSYGNDRATGRRLTDVQADNIGRLLRDVGYAVKMDYNPARAGGSGAYVYDAPRVLINNFGYKNSLRFLERSNFTINNWLKEVHDEMRDYGPIVYAGFSNGGGHCFVLDGYASNRFVHVDWGWNSNSNGWHLLTALQPGEEGIGGGYGGYSRNQQMLRYLKPDRDGDPDPDPNPNPEPRPNPTPDVETGANLYIAQKCEQTALPQSNYVPVTVTVGNRNENAAYSGRLALAIFKNGETRASIVATTSTAVSANASKAITFYANLANVTPDTYNLVVSYAKDSKYETINQIAGTVTIGKVKPEPKPDPKPDPSTLVPDLYAVQRVVEYVEKGKTPKIVATIANQGNATYDGDLKLYALPAGTNDTKQAVLISEGKAKIGKSQRVTFSFYTNDNIKELAEGKYSLVAGYFVNDKEIAVKPSSGSEAWKIGELTINPADNDEENITVHDVKLQTIFFYQNGKYIGSDNSFISKKYDTFTARVYIKSVNGYEGRISFYVTDQQYGSRPMNSNMVDKRTVSIKPNTNGYIEVSLPTRYLNSKRFYMNILFNNGGANWLYSPTDAVPFYTSSANDNPSDMTGWSSNPTMGPTFDFNEAPVYGEQYQSIGNKGEGGVIDSTTGINEVKTGNAELSVYPSVVTNEINVSAPNDGVVNMFSIQGKLIGKHNVKAGENVLDVTNLASGVYLINMGKATQKFIKK